MTITSSLFEAFLKCPTKCWLRAASEVPSGKTYAEWAHSQNESFHATETERLLAETPLAESVRSPSPESLKSGKWRLAVDVVARTPELPRSSRRQEAPSSNAEGGLRKVEFDQSLVTSAATARPAAPKAAFIAETHLHAVERMPSEGRGKAAQFIPIRFIFFNKLGKDDKLLLAFDAFVLSAALGRDIPAGKIIHGDTRSCARESAANPDAGAGGHQTETKTAPLPQAQPQVLKVKTSSLAGEVRKRLDKIAALLSSPTPPDLVLNRHCGECEFQSRCRKIAVEKDDLSLLGGMSEKERKKLQSKGIFTVTQLSYTFRPRRRPKKLRDNREKYHHSLKALAIREKKIHIVGSPELKIEGTPVYLDVEGLPDRDFYYLIGLRIGNGESAVQHSLWADTVEDEGKIWRAFLGILETVEKPVLIHYGSYETTFFRRMSECHRGPPKESAAMKAMEYAINLLSMIFAQVYFPTYSNGLKDVARWLGFDWAEAASSGTTAICWRYEWDENKLSQLKKSLVRYNTDDCRALELAVRISKDACKAPSASDSSNDLLNVVKVDGLKSRQTLWPRFSSPIAELEIVNKAASWDYQRHRIYLRTGKKRKRAVKANKRCSISASQTNEEIICQRPRICPLCERKGIKPVYSATRILFDLRFSKSGLRRWKVKYHFQSWYCPACHVCFGKPHEFWQGTNYGRNVAALLIYKTVDLCMQQRTIAQELNRLYQLGLNERQVPRLKAKAADLYEDSRRMILTEMLRGAVIQADETQIALHSRSAYVWVFATFREVVYFYSESREGDLPQKLLKGFKGVLVSDFYTVYDSLPCSQQKCLIHLMRDLNDAVLDNPYDVEARAIVMRFGSLLTNIVQTIDCRGLKRRFLRKHLVDVERFYRQLSRSSCQSEPALKLKDRFEKNRDKLFTFLNYDGVPWNNNNAEHAIKAFARLRKAIVGLSTPKGIEEYLILLSVCQTCKYMGVDFLDFLRSGEKDIYAFAESRRGHRRRSTTSKPKAPLADAPPEQ